MKNMKFSALLLLFFVIATVFPVGAFASADNPPDIAAERALVMDPASGTVLYEKNADERASPASLTKIMTALIIMEEGNLDDVVTVRQSALDALHPESSVAGLYAGEEMLMEFMLDCILIASANDACNAVAEHLYGSVDAFVARMNERAAELGCTNTQFKNAHGLTEEGHYSTARDIYKITLAALEHPMFLDICNTASLIVPATNKFGERTFYSTNHLISRLKNPDYIYHYAKGIKTGHTSAAGYCLVSSAEKNDHYYVCVVMGSRKDEETGKLMSFVDTKNLYEWAFDSFSEQQLLDSTKGLYELPVELSSDADYVVLKPESQLYALLPDTFDIEQVELKVSVDTPEGVTAPVVKGDKYGEVHVIWNGREYGSVPLVAMNSVALDKTLLYRQEVKAFFKQPWVLYVGLGIVFLIVAYIIFIIILNISRRRKRSRRRSYRGSSRNRGRR